MKTKTCSKCNRELPSTEFYKHRTRYDGLHSHCKDCKNNARYTHYRNNRSTYQRKRRELYDRQRDKESKYNRQYHAENQEGIAERKKNHNAIYPNRRKARNAVRDAIERNDLPPAWSIVCEDCGEMNGAEYHHDMGYEPENYLQVVCLCRQCHRKEHRIDGANNSIDGE